MEIVPIHETVTLQKSWLSMSLLIYSILLIVSPKLIDGASETTDPAEQMELTFPVDFLIGAASSSYQVEGAWNVSGKSESNWDYFMHNYPERVEDGSNADVSCDSYHKYKGDIQLMKDIGMNHYRFSISWPRILPTGLPDSLNQQGIDYYHNLLDELAYKGIVPFVTIYHWDHPQSLESWGGWMNETMVDYFAEYARVVFREFGPRVKIFATINEPHFFCNMIYKGWKLGLDSKETYWGQYDCIHNMLKAHAEAYHIYNREFRGEQNGEVGIITHSSRFYNKNEDDFQSAEIAFEMECGLTAHPIFTKEGDYPELMKRVIKEKSIEEGRAESKLPTFSEEWIQKIKGTSDFFGLIHYTSFLVEPISMEEENELSKAEDDPDNYQEVKHDEGLLATQDEDWGRTSATQMRIVPEGFGDVLRNIKERYNNPKVYIMENGAIDDDVVDDKIRKEYLYSYMKEMLLAMNRDGCNVKAYTIWSFLDCQEWFVGYQSKCGLVNVDFDDENRTRTPKPSAAWLRSVIQSRQLLPYN